MKYLLLAYAKEDAYNDEERAHCQKDAIALCHDLAAKGQYIAASPLHPVSTATSVRVRNGNRMVTDGPFAETTEQLGGYFLIDAENLDEAIAIAGRIPSASKGTIEVRPIFEMHGLPQPK